MDTSLAHLLPLAFMAVMGLCMLAYVVLDGYDLGIGLLLPLAGDDEKDVMVSSIGPFWDANETWLVLGIGVLLVAFPKAHGIVLSELYLPVAAMLIGLIIRGVSFDFRVKARDAHKALWNRLFFSGSLVATMAQGWMLGSYVTGFNHEVWGLLFALCIAITLPAAYIMLGCGWLIMKTDGALQDKAIAWARKALWPMGVMLAAISVASPLVSPIVFDKWFVLPEFLLLLPIPLACLGAFWAIHHVVRTPRIVQSGYGWIVFAATVLVIVLSFFGLAYSIYPFIVIERLTLWQAASSTEALAVMGIGVAVTLPVIVAYTIFMYRVFWGKATALRYGL
ncbi:cytochrome d ubiquinol oxidase subunit II [Stenotrophomonas sp. YIM B06876]|uniref:cytochrome d ubiquinol oxidase subunit II n=1 Tax=Stenotrophomonas sp. YIM B06876 TaxID=3060211 RepID=UPI00273A475A|nr:cytochrome d ubiquinol oxidase subunit II [Stenotrophomonas sp. YIM B06876]